MTSTKLSSVFVISYEEIINKFHYLLEKMVSARPGPEDEGEWGFTADEIRYEMCKFTISVLEMLTKVPEEDYHNLEMKWNNIVLRVVKYSLIELRRFDVATTIAMGMNPESRSRLVKMIFRRFKENPEIVGFAVHLVMLIRIELSFSKLI